MNAEEKKVSVAAGDSAEAGNTAHAAETSLPTAPESGSDATALAETGGDAVAARANAEAGVTEGGSFVDSAKMVITVTLIAAISAGLLGFVYSQTKPRIEESRLKEKVDAFGYILPTFDNQPIATECQVPLLDARGGGEYTPARPVSVFAAQEDGLTVGYAVQLSTTAGFGPLIDIIVGARPNGEVTGVYILNHQETPGLGAKVTDGQTEWGPDRKVEGRPFLHQFQGRAPEAGIEKFKVTKDGGEIDAITASTITSRAVANSVADAALTVKHLQDEGLPEACQAALAAQPAAAPAGAAAEGTGGAK